MIETIKERDKKIRKLRFEKEETFNVIAQKYGISVERVRQICKQPEDKEELLKEIGRKYKRKFNDYVTYKMLVEDIEELAKLNRKKEVVIRRKILIQFLYEELNLPFYRIADLLERDHTTIMHMYYDDRESW